MEHTPLHRYSLKDLLYMANHGGSGSLTGLYLRSMKEKGLLVIDDHPIRPNQGYGCTMTNKGWLVLLHKLGYDQFLLKEMWELLGHLNIADSRPFWQSLYRHHKVQAELV